MNHNDPKQGEQCMCPEQCDCESPNTNPVLISNNCPEHNEVPYPIEECKANVHKNGAHW